MASLAVIAIILLCKRGHGAPTPPSSSNRPCIDFMLPVPVTVQNGEYNLVDVHNNIDAASWAVDYTQHTSPPPQQRLMRNTTVSGTYNISVQLCIPPEGEKNTHLQIATHGVAFNKQYWDVAVNPSEYSYVHNAIDAGYSILTYDRLGTGHSDKPDARTVVQAPLELEILRGITEMARNGSIIEHVPKSSSRISVSRFEKFIHVGHSFGSFLTSALLATYGELSDAAVLTGFVLNPYLLEVDWAAFDLQYAAEYDPQLYGDRGVDYLIGGSKSALQIGFFSTRKNMTSNIGGFEPQLLDYGFSVRDTLTTTELVSSSQLNLGPAPNFQGPLQFNIGEFDYLVCKGDCRRIYNTSMIESLYPKLNPADFDFYIQPGTGHGLTLHNNATIGYKATFDWLDKNGF